MIRQITKNIAFQLKTSSIKNYVHKSINMVFQSSRFVNNKRSMYFSTNKMRNPYGNKILIERNFRRESQRNNRLNKESISWNRPKIPPRQKL